MLRSIFSNWLGLVVLGATSVILTPILIHGLGNFYYGMWVLVASILDYYGLLDLGMRGTLFRFVAHSKGANDRAALSEIFTTGLAITLSVAFVVIGVTFVLAWILPPFFVSEGTARHIFALLVILLGVSIGLTFPAHLLGAYLRGLQRFDLYNLGLIIGAFVRTGVLLALLRLGYGVLSVAVATLVITLISLSLNWVLVCHADRHVSFDWKQMRWQRIRELGQYSFYMFLSTSGDYLRFYTDSVVIGRVLGIALIAPFSISSRLMEYFRSIVGAANGPVMARMSELEGAARPGELRLVFLRATRMSSLLSLFLASLLLLNGRALIQLWVGDRFSSSYPLALILMAGYVVSFAQEPSRVLTFAQARYHRMLGRWYLIEGVANLLLSIYWAKRYGLLGVALGTVVPLLAGQLLVQPRYALQGLRLSGWDYLKKALAGPAAVEGLFLGLCWMAGMQQNQGSALHLLGTVGFEAALFGFLAYFLGLDAVDRHLLRGRWKQFAMSLRLA